MAKGKTDQKSKTVQTPVIILITVLVCAVFVGGILLAFKLGQGAKDSDGGSDTASVTTLREEVTVTVPGGRGMVATPENAESIKEWAESPVEDGYYEVRMNLDWNFPDGKSASSNAYVENSENNKRTVYFDIALKDTGEVVYSSPFIPVTAKLEEIKLDKELEKGEYPATMTYHLVDDNYEEITTLSVRLTLVIEN